MNGGGPRLELVAGCMFSGKSSELLRRVRRFRIAGYQVLLLKHAADRRYDEGGAITSHDHDTEECVATSLLETVVVSEGTQVVATDEIQFFEADDIRAFYERVVLPRQLFWICAGLITDWRCTAFPAWTALLPRADSIVTLSAVCAACQDRPATCSARHSPAVTPSAREVGGADLYWPACRRCWQEVEGQGALPVHHRRVRR